MKTLKTIVISSFAVLAFSCKMQTPYLTTPENIWKLEKDMSLAQINTTLGVDPYDIYINDQTHSKILIYKYRLRTQKFKHITFLSPIVNFWVPSHPDGESQLRNTTEAFRGRNEKELYVVLDSKSNKLVQYITETGREDAEDVQKRAFYFKTILPEKLQGSK